MKNIDLLDLTLDKLTFNVLDFETTGMSPQNSRVIEVGIVTVENLKITDTYHTMVNPGRDIPYFISKLTGITNNDVIFAPYFEEVAYNIKERLEGNVLVAHNAPFDSAFLYSELAQCGYGDEDYQTLCTLKLARKLYPELPSKSLGNVAKYLHVSHKNVHRALGDATVTAKIFIKMLEKLRDEKGVSSLQDLLNFQKAQIIRSKVYVKKKLADDYSKIPDMPGVYFFKDENDKVYYIGKAKSLRKRVSNYFTGKQERKTKKIIKTSSRLGYQVTNSELTALIAESELIKQHNPQINKQLKKFSITYFLKIDINQKFPVVKSTTKFEFDGSDYFGPYPNRFIVKDIVDIIDKAFLLRECPERQFSKKKRCYLAEIKRCTAPCENQDEALYKEEITNVYDFLCGKNQLATDLLLEKMKKLAEQKKFEEAAEIRDTIQKILKQITKTGALEGPVNKANVMITVKETSKPDYILLSQSRVYIKNDTANENNRFDEMYDELKSGQLSVFRDDPSPSDIERIKILLGWLVKNKSKTKIDSFELDNLE